jgi:outer membrane protein OmpA-like peptidoglycan-associated protein
MRGLLVGLLLASGCALFPNAKEAPFNPVQVTAKRPPPQERVVLLPSTIVISDKVQFELNKADLKSVSFPILDEVVAVMKSNPQIDSVEIEGHTDATGKADYNTTLSQSRAESVMKYIVSKGIAQGRLSAKGYGPDKPIAANDTPDGQEMNRRVEFRIVHQGPIKTIVKD